MKNKATLIFGIRAIIEAINSGKTIEKVYIQKGLSGSLFPESNRLIKKYYFINICYAFPYHNILYKFYKIVCNSCINFNLLAISHQI
ncbi:RNA methyltransferase substrate-binding domain-containing protein [Psychroserpens sp.]